MKKLAQLKSLLLSSLRFRLVLASFIVACIAAVASSAYTSWHAVHEVDEILNASLEQNARSLLAVLSDHGKFDNTGHVQKLIDSFSSPNTDITATTGEALPRFGDDDDEQSELLEYQRHMYLRVTHDPTSLDISTRNLPMDLPLVKTDGYFELKTSGHPWHFFSVRNQTAGLRLYLGHRADYRDEIIEESSESIVLEVVLLLPLLMLALWWAVAGTTRDLKNLSAEIASRESSNLDPVVHGLKLQETKGIVSELNHLLKRMRHTLDNERRFTSDASHELRTPIASMRAQLDVMQKAPSAPQREDAATQLSLACDRMTDLVENLLSLSRLDAESIQLDANRFDLRQLLRDVIAECAFQAINKEIEISLKPDSPLPVYSVENLHRLIAGNLVSNAIKYTTKGGHIDLHYSLQGGRYSYCIEDTGPGVPDNELDQLTQRFFRSNDTRHITEGTGLGLSIVQRAADLLDAEVIFSNRSPVGLRVEVRASVNPSSVDDVVNLN